MESGRKRPHSPQSQGAKAWLDGKCGLANKCAPVVSSVKSGTYADAQNVTLTSETSGAAIYYTDDGTIPSATGGTFYDDPIALADPSNTCIKAIATKIGVCQTATSWNYTLQSHRGWGFSPLPL